MKKEYVTAEGTVENVIYENEQSGFAVIEVATADELLPVVGELYGIRPGEEVKLLGEYVSHPRFGYQFKAESYERKLPAEATAIRRFLSSGVVKGIGPAMAERIVKTFGNETLQILEEDPLRLTEVKGISPKKADQLVEEFHRLFGMREVMMFLAVYGLTPIQSVKVWKRWGVLSLEIIKDNPYLLCDDEIEGDFSSADRIALGCGIDPKSPKRIFGAVSHILRHNQHNGHTCLPRDMVITLTTKLLPEVSADEVDIDIDNRIDDEELISMMKNREYLFLPECYMAESYIALRLSLMMQNFYFSPKNLDRMIDREEREKGIRYEKLQREAIRQSLTHGVMILTGGPGTGKTTTLNAIISLLEGEGMTLAIAAPTGRAAKRISEVTGREAKTIHRLLEVDHQSGSRLTFQRNEKDPLKADAVIIDEMSMVDTFLFEALLRGIKLGCKLILVGDSDQLPSVGAGNVLRDLIDSGCIPVVELHQVFRQAAQSLIVTNAHRIVNGEYPELYEKDNDFFFLRRGSENQVIRTVIELVSSRLPKSYGYSPLTDIQVLSPQRRGSMGVSVINNYLQEAINPKSPEKKEYKGIFCTFREGDKVLQIRNNYDIQWEKDGESGMGVFNGDIGIIRTIDPAAALMEVEFDERKCYYTFDMCSELELAYAITVHKSQGSEYDAVVLPLYRGFDKLHYRNLLYTAVTRAKKLLIIVGDEKRVEAMVDNNRRTLRYTGLKELLIERNTKG